LRDFVARDGEADKQVEDLAKLAEEASTLALVGAKERGVQVGFHFGPRLPPVLVDRIQIQQVLLNLIRNALEAMVQEEDEGMPRRRELTLTAALAEPDMVEVAVADTGPGIAPEIAGRLFNAFVSTKPGGMGMGLSICRSIIEAHGGRLWAEANPGGGGAIFRFKLPAAPLDAAAW
jgi:two-component system sensor kinase FixL